MTPPRLFFVKAKRDRIAFFPEKTVKTESCNEPARPIRQGYA